MGNSRSNRGTSPRARSRSKKTALASVAREIAQETYMDACNRVLKAAAVWTPKGSTKHAVELYLAAMRARLTHLENSWAEQQARS
jgi:hypothetical protein